MIQLYDKKTFDDSMEDGIFQLQYQNDETGMCIADGGEFNGPAHLSKGLTMSIWCKSNDALPKKFTMEFMKCMNACVRNHFNSYSCTISKVSIFLPAPGN